MLLDDLGLCFVHFQITERAAFVTRQYIKSSLYDRISTRPFLSSIEKKWLAFQFLYALKQCHEEKVSCLEFIIIGMLLLYIFFLPYVCLYLVDYSEF